MIKPLLSLVGIFKNEAHCIRKTLDSVKFIIDRWTLLDTGSTDGTQEIIQKTMWNVRGELYNELFVDFATSRNRVLELNTFVSHGHDHTGKIVVEELNEFTLMLSADEVLHGGDVLRKFLEEHRDAEHGAYSIEMRSHGSRWFYPRILRTSAGWKYVGKVHEVPIGPNGETHGPLIPGVYIEHTVSDFSRRYKRMREFDYPTLLKEVEDESLSLEARGQAMWFLAQTHEALADEKPRVPGGPWLSHKMAAMALYQRRAELGGTDEKKVHYATFRYLNVAEQLGIFGHAEMLARLELLAEMEPNIPEVRYMIAAHAAAIDVRRGAYLAEIAARVAREVREAPSSHLPTDGRVEWLSLKLAAECAKASGNTERAKKLAERAVNEAGGAHETFEEYLS